MKAIGLSLLFSLVAASFVVAMPALVQTLVGGIIFDDVRTTVRTPPPPTALVTPAIQPPSPALPSPSVQVPAVGPQQRAGGESSVATSGEVEGSPLPERRRNKEGDTPPDEPPPAEPDGVVAKGKAALKGVLAAKPKKAPQKPAKHPQPAGPRSRPVAARAGGDGPRVSRPHPPVKPPGLAGARPGGPKERGNGSPAAVGRWRDESTSSAKSKGPKRP